MGMAAGQARLLSITARLTDNENAGQALSFSKQRLADQADQINAAYNEALNATKLQVLTGFNGTDANYTDISYALMTGFNTVGCGKQYIVTNSADGKVLVTNKLADAFESGNGDYNKFLNALGYSQVDVDFATMDNDARYQTVHDAWDKYYKSVGISFPDNEHDTENPEVNFGYMFPTTVNELKDGYAYYVDTDYHYVPTPAVEFTYSPSYDYVPANAYPESERPNYLVPGTTYTAYKPVLDIDQGPVTIKRQKLKSDGSVEFDSNGNVVYETDTNGNFVYDTYTFNNDHNIYFWGTFGNVAKSDQGEYFLVEYTGDDSDGNYGVYRVRKTTYDRNVCNGSADNIAFKVRYPFVDGYEFPSFYDVFKTDSAGIQSVDYLQINPPGSTMWGLKSEKLTTSYNFRVDYVGKDGQNHKQDYTLFESGGFYINAGLNASHVRDICHNVVVSGEYMANVEHHPISKEVPINYEGTTAEQRDLYDYAIALAQYAAAYNYSEEKNVSLYNLLPTNDGKLVESLVDNPDNSELIQYYKNIFNAMLTYGYYTEANEADTIGSKNEYKPNSDYRSSVCWFEKQLREGKLSLKYFSAAEKAFVPTTVSEDSTIQEVQDERAIAMIEAKYEQDTAALESKDKKFDLELKKLDTEHSALQTEYESAKAIVDKNIEKSFNIFS